MVFVYSKTTCFSQNFSEVSPFFLIVFGVGLLKKGANWVQKNMRTFILQKKADVTRKKKKLNFVHLLTCKKRHQNKKNPVYDSVRLHTL